jgi:hypothetical protein
MLLHGFKIFKGIYLAKIAGVNQTHEHITDVSAVLGFEEQRIFPMQDGEKQGDILYSLCQ